MNLHNLARAGITRVNPDLPATILQSDGYEIDDDGIQQPRYSRLDGIPVQRQALTNDELRALEGLNIQGNKCAVYLHGKYSGIVRRESLGGDLFVILGVTWLVVQILEDWGVPGTADAWCKLALTQQLDQPPDVQGRLPSNLH
jgi:hypothetical protein